MLSDLWWKRIARGRRFELFQRVDRSWVDTDSLPSIDSASCTMIMMWTRHGKATIMCSCNKQASSSWMWLGRCKRAKATRSSAPSSLVWRKHSDRSRNSMLRPLEINRNWWVHSDGELTCYSRRLLRRSTSKSSHSRRAIGRLLTKSSHSTQTSWRRHLVKCG